MFIKYQNVRNVFFAGVLVALGGLVWISCGSIEKNGPRRSDASSGDASRRDAPAPRAASVPEAGPAKRPPPEAAPVVPPKKTSRTDPMQARYRAAMRMAEAPADPGGKGKDVLGPASPWKLNLYDDDKDGKWERGKLDYNRDGVDDEKWNFKNGRWEKEGGAKIWDGSNWIGAGADARPPAPREATVPLPEAAPVVPAKKPSRVDPMLARYRAAMRMATGPAAPGGKGKDVLGPASPWKLNLYDDDKDGKWDRGKLDYNRDEVDDEKWNFKNGRWEKEGGAKIWDGSNWIGAKK